MTLSQLHEEGAKDFETNVFWNVIRKHLTPETMGFISLQLANERTKAYEAGCMEGHEHGVLGLRETMDTEYRKGWNSALEWARERAADERDVVAKTTNDFNNLNDSYKEGYYIAMNTLMEMIDTYLSEGMEKEV